jgi:hypothetical protein
MHGREPQPARIDRQNRNTVSHNVCAVRVVSKGFSGAVSQAARGASP